MAEEKWIEDNMDDPIAESGAEFEGDIWMSTDGKHSVHATAKTPEGRKDALKWTKAVFDRLMYTYGSKQSQAVKEYKKAETDGNEFVCPIDGVPYEQKTGKFGVFWSHYVGKGADGKPIYHTKKD